MYKIIIEKPAIFDLRGIRNYIANELKEPDTARRIYFSIKQKITTLDRFPLRYQLVDDYILASQGVRMLPAENYLAFYVVDETDKKVHLLRVLHSRRDWQSLIALSVVE